MSEFSVSGYLLESKCSRLADCSRKYFGVNFDFLSPIVSEKALEKLQLWWGRGRSPLKSSPVHLRSDKSRSVSVEEPVKCES